jgi:hypothetical protein
MRSVRVDPPPTVEDALFAAEGLTPIVEQQVVIAAGLLVVPIEEVRSEAKRILGEKTIRTTIQGRRREPMSSVAVVRKTSRRLGYLR